MSRNGADFVCVMDGFVMSVCVCVCGCVLPVRHRVFYIRADHLFLTRGLWTGGREGQQEGGGDGQRQVHDNDTVRRTSIPLCFKHNTFSKGTTPH